MGQQPELVVRTGHTGSVDSVVFSPDGKTLASGGNDSTIKLWDVATGRELRTFAGHSENVFTVSFSPDGQTLASCSADKTIKLWSLATGRELQTLTGHTGSVFSIAFSRDGLTLASGGGDDAIKLWEVSSGRELRSIADSVGVGSVTFSPDGKTLAGGDKTNTIRLWDLTTGRVIRTFTGHSDLIRSAVFSADGKTLATSSLDRTIRVWEVETGREVRSFSDPEGANSVAFSGDGRTLAADQRYRTIRLWEVATGREIFTLSGHTRPIESIAFSPDGKTLASSSRDGVIKLWNAVTGRELRTLIGYARPITSVAVSTDGKTLAGGSGHGTIKLWDATNGREIRTLAISSPVTAVAFAADGKTLASGSDDRAIKLWDVTTGREIRTLTGHSGRVTSVAFSADRQTLASGSRDGYVKLWDIASGRELRSLEAHSSFVESVVFAADGRTIASSGGDKLIKLWDVATGRAIVTLTGHSYDVNSVAFNRDGTTLASGSGDGTVTLWDVATRREIRTLRGHSSFVTSVAFGADGKTLASGSWDHTIKLWDVATGRELRTLLGHSHFVMSIALSADGKFLFSGSADCTIKIWRLADGELLASLIGLAETDWAVVAPDGRFDASPNAQKLMHWIVGREPIELEQLKERYYEPGLLAKILSEQPQRDVSKFESPRLYPEVKYQAPAPGSSRLIVTLTNRGGGIGRVQVFVNGKEFLSDARDDRLKQNPNQNQARLNIDLEGAPGAIAGGENQIRVVAWNVENYIFSRGEETPWLVGGPPSKDTPEVYAIIGGISRYAGPKLNLNFAGKDAVDVGNALELGARRLFGADKVHLTLLSSAADPRAIPPTKENFARAFAAARRAKPADILIVYLAGHGITLQRGADTYCYLTQEARTTDTAVLSDPEVRKQQTITSEELVDWIKQIPANKQAVMLDTCAAGAAKGYLTMAAMRDASGDAIRAIERAKDRTGSHILMGSAADAVSYEASQYGQGLLTYALLKGMKGPALRDDKLVDISRLFRFAREEVEQLAKNVDKMQKPIIFAPNDDSFDVGQLNLEDKQKIALAAPKPMILRPRFLDSQAGDDTIDLMKTVRELLRDETFVTGRGATEPALIFVDDDEFPGGIRPTGGYTIEGNKVTVTLRLRRDGIDIFSAPVTGTKDEVAAKVIEAIKAAIRRL